ncbi:hypothetical protein L7F22_027618 [Adiantum nelumboides]|nr:hypothetical protein [Adiantum nelumboides]MCO5573843.1 hypothetical protein [Adiantum nelumboides]
MWILLRVTLVSLVLHGVVMVRAASGLEKDTQGLLSFKQVIEKDPFGMLEGWGTSSTNSCEWRGVSCINGRVAGLDVSNGGLVAPLPVATLAPLDQLKALRLQGNAFYGYGSEQVVSSACSTLTILDLSSNNLMGTFAASSNVLCTTLTYLNLSRNSFRGSFTKFGFVGAGSTLSTLDLSFNNLTGSIPPELFSQCGSLTWLDISHNSITGSIPEGVSACSTLVHLDLSHNLLNSTLPIDIISPFSSSTSKSMKFSASLTYLNLSFNELGGELPDTLQSPVLVVLDLSTNFFTGSIPSSISSSTALRLLNFSCNTLSGPLPPAFSQLINLRGLYLSDNNLTGSIPAEFGNAFVALEELDFSVNRLVGSIPASFANCSALRNLNLGTNFLSGKLPLDVVCSMPALQMLKLAFNNLTGTLPAGGLSACKFLTKLDLSANRITGTLPDSFCAPQLQQMLLQDNDLVGAVPEGLGNCTSLTILDLSCNLLSGLLPLSISRLPLLQDLMMWGNFLKGPIPSSLGTALHLRKLVLNINLFTGTIPAALANCSSLEWISLNNNLLSGIIPPELGNLPNLGILQLANNTLSGPVPTTLGTSTKLIWLDLNNNLLEGPVPIELAKQTGKVTRGTLDQGSEYAFLKNLGAGCVGLGGLIEYSGIRDETLFQLDAVKHSCNVTRLYHGTDPYFFPETGGSLEYLDIGYNRLTGTIPSELGSLSTLLVLSLSHNALTGPIPESLSNLVLLTILYLDHNMLQGPIPPSLSTLGLLNQLDLSYNNLSGPIPELGTMSTMPSSVFANNLGLCGSPLPPCGYNPDANTSASSSSKDNGGSSGWSTVAIAMSSVGAFAIVIAGMSCVIASIMVTQQKMRQHARDSYMENLPSGSGSNSWNINGVSEPLSINVATFEKPLRKLTFAHLLEATNGFSQEAVIGRGGFGEVYKATLEGGIVVAIKKLVHTVSQGDREFMAEMETIGKIKHRNLVPLLGYCKVGQERLLVYEYMEGGSLDRRLHEECYHSDDSGPLDGPPALSWDIRKRIAFGTARGLCFLHHSCIPHIIHRDLKSSNVLLDDALEARVSDFGMARLVSAAETHLSVSSLVGTPGYVPPEYCHSFRCTSKGDVYSFGVVLLELITGRRPTWSSSMKCVRSKSVASTPLSPTTTESDRGSTSTTTGASVTPPLSATPVREECAVDEELAGGTDLVGWVKKQLQAGKKGELLDERAFPSAKGAIIPPNWESMEKEMLKYLEIACCCVEQSPHKRPTMLEVMALFRELHQDQGLDSL